MLQVTNRTRFLPLFSVIPDEAGTDTLFVVVTGTFPLGPAAAPPEPVPPRAADVYWGEPGRSSVKYASDVHVGKRGTDVVLVGSAHAPGGRPVTEMLVAVSVAERRKVVRVFGDRSWRAVTSTPSRPEPFASMPLVYERAFGGTHEPADGRGAVLAEERNPVGVGFRDHKLPNLEDPMKPLARQGDRPPPAGFGCIAPSWLPRRNFAGTYDDTWKNDRAPYLPRDFDRRFCNAAHPDLAFDRFLEGGEPLQINGASPAGLLGGRLPSERPRVAVVIAGKRERPPAVLETVLLEPDEGRLCLTWRATLPCDKKALKIQTITIEDAKDAG